MKASHPLPALVLPRPSPLALIVTMLVMAILLRAPLYGNPVIQSDEQYYLLVGDRILHGALPYVDIWDRKPIGLFLLFTAIRLLGGIGIIQYQVVATLFAAATAFVLVRFVGIAAPRRAAMAAGFSYLIWLDIFDGAGAQDPIFFNLFMAGAGLLTFRAAFGGRADRLGAPAMALVGVALQFKYTTVVEGIFFGLVLLEALWRAGASWRRLLKYASIWIAVALAPTLIALLVYWGIGHSREFLFANFVSIFGRGPDASAKEHLLELLQAFAGASPLLALGAYRVFSAKAAHGSLERQVQRFGLMWFAVALLSILVVGTYKGHYFLPLLLPLTIVAATPLSHFRIAVPLLLLGCIVAAFTVRDHIRRRGTREQVNALVALIGQRPLRCMFSFGSEPILYHLTRSCIPTPYAFRSHLRDLREANAIGVDPTQEVKRVLAQRPSVIVTRNASKGINPVTATTVSRVVSHNYQLAGTVRVGSYLHYVYKIAGKISGRAASHGAAVQGRASPDPA